jgi:hypothetical protein
MVVPVIRSGLTLSLLLFAMRPEDRDQFRREGNRLLPSLLDGPQHQAPALSVRAGLRVPLAILGTQVRDY